ncbi:MAG: ATP-binding domain-containing protein [Moraxellaceae bacterium]
MVFVDHGYIEPTQLDNSFLRWLYTATTRATDQLYFVNLLQELVEEN